MIKPSRPIPLVFWRSASGREPVREWLTALPKDDKRTIGRDINKVQFGWPMGLPLCRSLGAGLWEVRSSLRSQREARVFFGFHEEILVALHAIIKKARRASVDDLAHARVRLREVQSWPRKTHT